jgi:hypothetical protein
LEDWRVDLSQLVELPVGSIRRGTVLVEKRETEF